MRFCHFHIYFSTLLPPYPDDDDLHLWTAMFADAINAHVLTHTHTHTCARIDTRVGRRF